MKNLIRFLGIATLTPLISFTATASQELVPMNLESIHWVVDEAPNQQFPRNFRMASDPLKHSANTIPNRQGLEKIRASASAQFSERTLRQAIPLFKGPFMVVDFRQETHGYINGIPISNYIFQNRVNQGKSPEEIAKIEQQLFQTLGQLRHKVIYNVVKEASGEVSFNNPSTVKVHRSETERQLVKRLGGQYHRFYVLDHHPATPVHIDGFVALLQQIQADTWLHLHCRGGSGRATTFMVVYDIFQNGHEVSFEDIIERQHLLGGKNLAKFVNDPNLAWKHQPAMTRYQLLKQFYAYMNHPKGYPHQTFEAWMSHHPLSTLAACNGQDENENC